MENVTDISDGRVPLCLQQGNFRGKVFMLHVLKILLCLFKCTRSAEELQILRSQKTVCLRQGSLYGEVLERLKFSLD